MKNTCGRRSVLQSLAAASSVGLLSGVGSADSDHETDTDEFGIDWSDVSETERGGRGFDIVRTSGGYLLGGVIHTDYERTSDEGLLRKIDLNGVLSWETRYQREGGWHIAAVSELNGGYVAVANREDAAGVAVLGYDAYGDLAWERRLGESENDKLFDLVVGDGSIIAVGRREQSVEHEYDQWALQCGADGTIEWSRTYPTSDEESTFETLAKSESNGLHVLGRAQVEGGEPNRVSYCRLSMDGTLETRMKISVREPNTYPSGITALDSGGFLAMGSVHDQDGDRTSWVRKYDANLETEWTWIKEDGSYNGARDGIVMPDGSYLVVGRTQVTAIPWAIRFDADGSVRWEENYTVGVDFDEFTGVVRAPGGAMAAGMSWSKGQPDWPSPWMARLSFLGETSPDGFDPRLHGFGFDNWAGESGLTADGEEFTLPYEGVSKNETENWLRGLDSPIERGYDLWDGSKELVQSLGNRMYSTDGHCTGIVHAADYYYHTPSALPRTIGAANEVSSPTGEYRYIGERIRDMQFLPEHGINAYVDMTQMGAPGTRLDHSLEKILGAVDRTGTAPIALNLKDGGKHAVLAYHYREDGDETEILYYDPNLRAEKYLSPNQEVGVNLDEPDSDEDRAFDNPQRLLVVDDAGDIQESTIPITNYAYLPLEKIANAYDGDAAAVKSIVDTLRLPAPSAPVDPGEVVPDAESISIFRFDSSGGLTVKTDAGDELPTIGTEWATDNLVEYEELAWDVGTDPSDYTVEVSGDIGDDYSLDVKGMVPDGGQISSTLTGTFSSSRTHEVETTIPDSGEGSVEVVNRSDPVEDDSVGGSGTASSSESGSGDGSGWGTKELAAVAGILTLVSLGYFTRSGD